MAEVISLMDVDDDNPSQHDKGKAVMASGGVPPPPNHTKATPWVEKFRPQSLADVAAHRDIIDTSMLIAVFYILGFRISVGKCNCRLFVDWGFLVNS